MEANAQANHPLKAANEPVDPGSWEVMADAASLESHVAEMVSEQWGVMRVEFEDGGVCWLFSGEVDGDPRVRMKSRSVGSSTFCGGPIAPNAQDAVEAMVLRGVSKVHFSDWAGEPA